MIVDWQPGSTAPKDGSHIIVCCGPYYPRWGFDQCPPIVVHYWGAIGEEGFYLSNGIVQDSYNDVPQVFTHWCRLDPPTDGFTHDR